MSARTVTSADRPMAAGPVVEHGPSLTKEPRSGLGPRRALSLLTPNCVVVGFCYQGQFEMGWRDLPSQCDAFAKRVGCHASGADATNCRL